MFQSQKAKIVSDYICSKHLNVVISKENFLENLQEIIEVRDTPVSIPHEYPLFLLNKEIKKNIKVVLSGEGADEFFGGYSRVQKSPFDFNKTNFFTQSFDKMKFFNFFLDRYKWFGVEEKEKLFSEDSKKIINNELVYKPFKDIFLIK